MYCESCELVNEMSNLLQDLIVKAGFTVSGPTASRAAENGEPIWVCQARELIAKGASHD